LDAIETVAVLGAGEAAGVWALLAALARCAVRLHHASLDALETTATAVRERVDLATGTGLLTRTERQRILDGILFTPDLEEAVTAADLLVDAGAEADLAWPQLAGLLRASAPVAAAGPRTPAELARHLGHPGRLLLLRLVHVPGPLFRAELAPGPETVPHALARVRRWIERLNKASGQRR
jgi:3-hydroxybutyryl-CoA dehydrogenase